MNIDLEKDIVQSLSSLYPLQEFEEKAIDIVLNAIPHWISVTDRPPEIGAYVLCTVKQPYRGRFHVCKYVDKDKWHDHPYFDWWHNGFPDVIAWMSIPEVYKGE